MEPIVINIVGQRGSYKLISRKIWEALFRAVGADKFRTLATFLCDLYAFEEFAEKWQVETVFYWGFDSYESAWTENSLEDRGMEVCYEIKIESQQIIITQIRDLINAKSHPTPAASWWRRLFSVPV